MLKHKRKHIVSTLFDTINKMSVDEASESACEAVTCESAVEAENTKNYIVSVPTLPLKITRGKPIMICTYQVRADGIYPFIMFLLKKKATFIQVEQHKNIKYAAIACMHSILPRATITYAGFYESEENNIIILSAEDTTIIHSDYIWATSFEVINLKHIMNSPVNPAVIAFFMANPAFLLLKDKRNRIYESPMIGYKTHENTCDETEMDIYRETIIPSLGKCYYIDIDIPKTYASIMRIAFFAGKMGLNKEKPYDSMLCGANIFGANQYYIIHDYDQHIVL